MGNVLSNLERRSINSEKCIYDEISENTFTFHKLQEQNGE